MAVKRTAPTTNVTCLEAIFAFPQSDNADADSLQIPDSCTANKHLRRKADHRRPRAERMIDRPSGCGETRAAGSGRLGRGLL
jgi:hypothetical protein